MPYNIPGLEILLTIIIITIVGGLSLSFLGKKFLQIIDDLFKKIPILRTIYSAIGQMTESLTTKNENSKNQSIDTNFVDEKISFEGKKFILVPDFFVFFKNLIEFKALPFLKEIKYSFLWIIPVIIGLVVLAVIASKRKTKRKSKSTPVTMVFFQSVRPKWSRRKTSTSRKVSSGDSTFPMTIPPSIQKIRFWEETSGPGNFRNSGTRSIPSSPKASNAGKR